MDKPVTSLPDVRALMDKLVSAWGNLDAYAQAHEEPLIVADALMLLHASKEMVARHLSERRVTPAAARVWAEAVIAADRSDLLALLEYYGMDLSMDDAWRCVEGPSKVRRALMRKPAAAFPVEAPGVKGSGFLLHRFGLCAIRGDFAALQAAWDQPGMHTPGSAQQLLEGLSNLRVAYQAAPEDDLRWCAQLALWWKRALEAGANAHEGTQAMTVFVQSGFSNWAKVANPDDFDVHPTRHQRASSLFTPCSRLCDSIQWWWGSHLTPTDSLSPHAIDVLGQLRSIAWMDGQPASALHWFDMLDDLEYRKKPAQASDLPLARGCPLDVNGAPPAADAVVMAMLGVYTITLTRLIGQATFDTVPPITDQRLRAWQRAVVLKILDERSGTKHYEEVLAWLDDAALQPYAWMTPSQINTWDQWRERLKPALAEYNEAARGLLGASESKARHRSAGLKLAWLLDAVPCLPGAQARF